LRGTTSEKEGGCERRELALEIMMEVSGMKFGVLDTDGYSIAREIDRAEGA
jgi:hypothetical protein